MLRPMQKFKVKPIDDLVESDFVEYPFWVGYYEPDEMDWLVRLGFQRDEVQKAMQMVNFSDAYAFPLPSTAVGLEFNSLYVSSIFTTPAGRRLVGYVHGPAFGVYLEGRCHLFNPRLRDFWRDLERELRSALGTEAFPLECVGVAGSVRTTFDDIR